MGILQVCTTMGGDVKFQISSKRLGGLHIVANGHINAQYIKKFSLESNTRVPTSSHNKGLDPCLSSKTNELV